MYTGPNIVRDRLVYYHDTGNIKKSFLGEPTTNLVQNPLFANEAFTNWATTGQQSISGKIAKVKGRGPNTMSYVLQDILLPTGPITLSFKARTINANIEGTVYSDSGPRIRFYGYNTVLPADSDWTYYTHTTTMSADSTSRLEFSMHDVAANGVMEIKDIQVEQKSYATPFAGIARSNTKSLVDLTGNTILDVSTASFDSNGLLFDGVNDYIDTQIETSFPTLPEGFSVFAVVEDISAGNNYIVCQTFSWSYSSNFILGYSNGGLWFRGVTLSGQNIILDGKKHQIGLVDYNGTATLYIDGNLIGSINHSINASVGSVKLMTRGDAAGSFVNGRLHQCKIWERALTQQEVKRNFRAIKSRFNI
jgi:hypothetical protein